VLERGQEYLLPHSLLHAREERYDSGGVVNENPGEEDKKRKRVKTGYCLVSARRPHHVQEHI